ncbi:MAG: DNA recombination protein RmuC, partial [Gemmatimonadetes bacterium]|nr:DNA recombination protein RmuC [Gemmatimonadota bacterium]
QLAAQQFEKHGERATAELDKRRQAIDELVKPVRESLEKVEAGIQEVEKTRREDYGGLSQQVQGLLEAQLRLQAETSNLVKALRAPTVRGRWGEVQLRRVVEMAGMVAYCDFVEQETLETDERRRRPDMVVRLPNGRRIVVDSKVPLEHYLNALEAQDDAARRAHLAEHARQVRDHVRALAAKSYWDALEETPEFVVLFLPGENFFGAALEHDPALIEHGVDNRVLLATPTTLIALLKAVAYGWRQERLAESAREVSELGRALYERLYKMAEHLHKLRRALNASVKAFNDAIGSLESRVLVSARRFPELGVRAGEDIPELQPIERTARELTAPELQIAGSGKAEPKE